MDVSPSSHRIIVLAGPTASGKTDLAVELAEHLEPEGGAVIINADSMQVYRELCVLSARPGAADEARAPHRLFGVLPASTPCSAALWRDLAVLEIAQARAEGRIPLLVGGTGLYFRALLEGLAPVPEVPREVREEARQRHRRLGGENFHRELAAIDPDMAARLQPGDRQRLIRAWEVLQATGRSLAEWQALPPEGPKLTGTVVRLVLDPPRDWLYQRCDARLRAMVTAGGLEEAERLHSLSLDPELPAMKALGVPEFTSFVRGKMSLEDAVAAAQTATRRYAKRQLTWFRHQMPDAVVIRETDAEARLGQASVALRGGL